MYLGKCDQAVCNGTGIGYDLWTISGNSSWSWGDGSASCDIAGIATQVEPIPFVGMYRHTHTHKRRVSE
jgi:hypothetical protein